MATIAVRIDPGQAVQGARTVKRSLDEVKAAAQGMEQSVDRAAASAGKLGNQQAANGARLIQRSLSDVNTASERAAGGLDKFSRTGGSVADMAGRTARSVGAANDNFARLQMQAVAVTGTFRTLLTVLGPLGALFSISALQQYADGWSDMQSRVGAAVKDMEAAPALMERLVDIANASYAPLSQTVEVYARNVGVLRDLGRGATQAVDFTEALNHALVITATRGERAASVQDALSKAMALGKLQADGLETVLANGGRVAEALAKELNTSVSGLRKMASDGKITGDVIANALIKNLQQLRDEAAQMPATIGDAFVRLGTNLTALIGQMDKASGVSEAIAGALLTLADNLRRVATYAATAVTAFGTYYVAAFVAANLATVTLSGSLALLRVALIRTGIGALVVGAGELAYQFTNLVEKTGSFSAAFEELGKRSVFLLDGLKFGFFAATEYIRSAWSAMLADMLRTTEAAFGPILRTFGISAADVQKNIEGLERRAKDWKDVAASSSEIAREQFGEAFKDIKVSSEDAAGGADKLTRATAALTEEQEKAAKQAKDRALNRAEAVRQAQEELTLVGKSASEVARLTAEYQFMAEARRDAIGGIVSTDEIARIKEAAAEIGKLADQLERARLADDLTFEGMQMNRSPQEAAIAQRLRGTGIGMNSPYANYMRTMDRVQEQRDLATGFFGSVKDAVLNGGEDVGKSLLKAIANSFANAADHFLDQAINSLVRALFPMPNAPAGMGGNGFMNMLNGIAPANQNSPSGGVASQAVSLAGNLLGANENTNRTQINSYLRAGGVDLDAAQQAWCAAFVNSSLKQVGVDGSGSNVATSFMGWGSEVTGSIMRGDVLVQNRGLSMGQTGGHVGLATGATRMGANGLELQMLSGNQSNSVTNTWVNAANTIARRAEGAGQALAGVADTAGMAGQGLGQFGNMLSQFPAAPGASGGGGGLFGWIGSLFGGGGGGLFTANHSGNLGARWSSGGYTGPGGVNDPAGIVHKGEVVWSQRDVSRAGGPMVVDAMRRGAKGYAAGGMVGRVQAPANGNGGMQVHIHNNAGAEVQVQRSQDENGNERLDVLVDRMVAQKLSDTGSRSTKALKSTYDMQRKLVRY